MQGGITAVGLITEECLRRIQDANDIVSVAESYGLQLRQVGSNFTALCPFHNEKSPSFNINPHMQIFKCFGCGAKGGIFQFVQMMERCEFPEAIEILAARAGIPVEREDGAGPSGTGEADKKKALYAANRLACQYYEQSFADPVIGKIARDYMQQRGFTPETISAWRLGWAPDEWEGLVGYIREFVSHKWGEHKVESAIDAGVQAGVLRYKEETDRTYDAFRGRVMFPILDAQQRPVGFGGRVLEEKPDSGGKYINTSEGKVFSKRKLLFGLSEAAKEIGLKKEAIVVEGYVDTIMCHQYGIRNVVATLGTALTEDHIRLLRRYIQAEGHVVALFDSDNAGRKATERAVRLFMEEDVPLKVAQGLEVKDAGEFLPQFGADAFRQMLAKSEDSFKYMLRQTVGSCPAGDVTARSTAVATVMDLVNCCPNGVKREMMRQAVAAASGVPVEALPQPSEKARTQKNEFHKGARRESWQEKRAEVTENNGRSGRREPRGLGAVMPFTSDSRREGRRKREQQLVRYLLASKQWCDAIMHAFPPDEWSWHAAAELAGLIRDAWEEGGPEAASRPDPAALMHQASDPEAAVLVADLAAGGPSATESAGPELTEMGLKDLLASIVRERLEQESEDLKAEIQEAEERGDHERAQACLLRKLDVDRRRKQQILS